MSVNCKICNSRSEKIFQANILQKYPVDYFECSVCGFIQTLEPYWLNEAYATAMTALDVGLLDRNLKIGRELPSILERISGPNASYLDYGGGYGLLVRMMRDKGFDFYLDDKYADNKFARYFEKQDGPEVYEAVTSFEVFEHLPDPLSTIDYLFTHADTIIFSTELVPQAGLKDPEDWWYFAPQTGQHISFFSRRSLEVLAEKFGCQLHTNEVNLHMLSRRRYSFNAITGPVPGKKAKLRQIFSRPAGTQRTSLLDKDFELYKRKLIESAHS